MKRRRPNAPTNAPSDAKRLKLSGSQLGQNAMLPKLPPNITIAKRPINKPPSASPYAGAHVPKVVYVSRKTPVISAVKRVKKFLGEIERRALQSVGVDKLGLDGGSARRGKGGDGGEELKRKLVEVGEKVGRDGEEVVVKGCGRAREQALRVGEWFRLREEEISVNVVVREGKTSVVDDLVEREEGSNDEGQEGGNAGGAGGEDKENEGADDSVVLDGGDTTLELLRRHEALQHGQSPTPEKAPGNADETVPKPKRRRPRKKRREYDPDDMPEARLRWVSTVEVALSLRA